MASTEGLVRALKRRGYGCSMGHTAEGSVCIIHRGPDGEFAPPLQIHRRNPLYPYDGNFQWIAGTEKRRTGLDVDVEDLADQIVGSISST